MERTGLLRTTPFDAAGCPGATLADISQDKLQWFLSTARHERRYAIAENSPVRDAMADLNLNKRQRKAVTLVKANGLLTNAELRNLTGAISRTVARDLDDLVRKGVLEKVGQSGRRVHYVAARKQDINRT